VYPRDRMASICWAFIVLGGDGMHTGAGHVGAVPLGVHDFLHVADSGL
jgi:hypothetical protein